MFRKIAIIIAAITALFLMTACGPTAPTAISSEGTWSANNAAGTGEFVAKVSGDVITIDMVTDGTAMTYWAGTFDKADLNDGDVITSKADREKLDTSIFGSSADTKDFTVEDGRLTFDFEMLGVKSTIGLEKQA